VDQARCTASSSASPQVTIRRIIKPEGEDDGADGHSGAIGPIRAARAAKRAAAASTTKEHLVDLCENEDEMSTFTSTRRRYPHSPMIRMAPS